MFRVERLRFFLAAATILTGLLAGETIDRLAIGFRAWQHVDISAWAEYSRNADLGYGIFVYPFEAIGSFLLLTMASIILLKNKTIKNPLSLPVHLASILAASGLVLTFFAGPFMLSIRNINEPALLQHAFYQFYYWSTFRGFAQVLSFFACVWAMYRAFTRLQI